MFVPIAGAGTDGLLSVLDNLGVGTAPEVTSAVVSSRSDAPNTFPALRKRTDTSGHVVSGQNRLRAMRTGGTVLIIASAVARAHARCLPAPRRSVRFCALQDVSS